uniref:Uncharacterized protein n=1 Tax=Bacteriophage sp. TaxID=38018 RepID=A0A8D9PF34_9VIRU|nr:MAG TPA: hypothetical protein [Bacteriophage sp.]
MLFKILDFTGENAPVLPNKSIILFSFASKKRMGLTPSSVYLSLLTSVNLCTKKVIQIQQSHQ